MEHPTAVELFDRVALVAPNSAAVRSHDGTLTYLELGQRAERLARHLRRFGVKPGDLVGLCLERSAALAVAALAAFRVGAAYVGTDPAHPDERLRWMFDDAAVAMVVADRRNAGRLLGDRATVGLGPGGELPAATAGVDTDPLPAPPRDGDLAYVVYASWSAGHPKGVMVEHAGLANLIAWHHGAFGLTDSDRCTQIASPGFDAAVWELWSTLAAGAALHVVPDALRGDPLGLRDWLVAEGITVGFVPTAVAEALIALPWPPDAPLRQLLTGGDALTHRPAADLGFEVVNNHGLSETAVVATSGAVAAEGSGPPSIGRPISGFRIEPAEIAAALDSHPAIDSSAVLGVAGSGADLKFVAYAVASEIARPGDAELDEFVSARLPEHMVPAHYIWLSELPLTAHGKLDRNALRGAVPQDPAPAASVELSARESKTSVERAVASVAAELLSVEQVGPDENFFLLGGHSMLGAQLLVRVHDLLGVEISLRYLFDHPTPAEIADEVTRQKARWPAADLIAG